MRRLDVAIEPIDDTLASNSNNQYWRVTEADTKGVSCRHRLLPRSRDRRVLRNHFRVKCSLTSSSQNSSASSKDQTRACGPWNVIPISSQVHRGNCSSPSALADVCVYLDRRIWLRPGKKYLFGRTLDPKGKSCENDASTNTSLLSCLSADKISASFQLKDEKSVSRQHLTLTVSNVKPGDGVSPICEHHSGIRF